VCTQETLVTIGDVKEPFKSENLLALSEVEGRCAKDTMDALKKLKDLDKVSFLKQIQNHFIAAASHLL